MLRYIIIMMIGSPIQRQIPQSQVWSLPKTGPLRFGSENQFPLNFAHEYILIQK